MDKNSEELFEQALFLLKELTGFCYDCVQHHHGKAEARKRLNMIKRDARLLLQKHKKNEKDD